MNTGDIRLLIGLGNPGSKYQNTRHNIGFMVLERLAKQEKESFLLNKKIFGYISKIGLGRKTILLLPNTFMNESGLSIKSAMHWFGLEANQILVISDDIDLPVGKIRLRKQGSAGGHNGLKSIIQHIGTQNFCRLKIGIGRSESLQGESSHKTISHVLGSFNKCELAVIEEVINKVIKGLSLLENKNLEDAQNFLNSYKQQGGATNND